MNTLDAFLAGCGMTLLGFLILHFRLLLHSRMVLALVVAALLTSFASAIVIEELRTISGVVLNHGYPRPYYFRVAGSGASFDGLYFGANTTLHLGALSLIAAALSGKRSGVGGPLLIRMALGFVFLILGIIGSLLPVLQGWVFFLLAFLVFFPRSPLTEKILRKVEQKTPRIARMLRRMGIGEIAWRDTMRAE
jgi:hypothetical protein